MIQAVHFQWDLRISAMGLFRMPRTVCWVSGQAGFSCLILCAWISGLPPHKMRFGHAREVVCASDCLPQRRSRKILPDLERAFLVNGKET